MITSPYIDLGHPITTDFHRLIKLPLKSLLGGLSGGRACLFPRRATWAGEEVGSRERDPVELEWEGSSYQGDDLIGPTERGGSGRLHLMSLRVGVGRLNHLSLVRSVLVSSLRRCWLP